MGRSQGLLPALHKRSRNLKLSLTPECARSCGFDCSKIHELGIDKQENHEGWSHQDCLRLRQPGGSLPLSIPFTRLSKKRWPALAYGGTDVDLISPQTGRGPHITQSETYSLANPDNPNQIVVTYNDSRGVASQPDQHLWRIVFHRRRHHLYPYHQRQPVTAPSPIPWATPLFCINKPTQTWFAILLDMGCGGQGLGGYKSTNPSDPNSWTHFCVHNNGSDDRKSGWADNNPSSPFFGRMYVSWNNFNVGGGALQVREIY